MAASTRFERALDELISALRTDAMPSARNLLATVFGDTVRPCGEPIAVRSLSRLLGRFGTSERLVRTSLTRLAGDQLVTVTKVGNRSFYGVHPSAERLFERAERRIYAKPDRAWDGHWTLVVIDGNHGTAASRAALRRELEWLGLGVVAPNVLASPIVSHDAVVEAMHHVAHPGGVLVTRSTTVEGGGSITDAGLARQCAPIEALAASYDQLAGWFRPLADALAQGGERVDLAPDVAYTARVLAIACYRRIVLADPLLPPSLLPGTWSGNEAYALVGAIYRGVLVSSEAWIRDVARTPAGRLARVARPRRFADL